MGASLASEPASKPEAPPLARAAVAHSSAAALGGRKNRCRIAFGQPCTRGTGSGKEAAQPAWRADCQQSLLCLAAPFLPNRRFRTNSSGGNAYPAASLICTGAQRTPGTLPNTQGPPQKFSTRPSGRKKASSWRCAASNRRTASWTPFSNSGAVLFNGGGEPPTSKGTQADPSKGAATSGMP